MTDSNTDEEVSRFVRALREKRARRASARLFGVPYTQQLSKARRLLAREIVSTFEAVRERCMLCEREVFERTYPFDAQRAHSAFWAFIRDVRTCPEEVLRCAEKLLAEVHAVTLRTD